MSIKIFKLSIKTVLIINIIFNSFLLIISPAAIFALLMSGEGGGGNTTFIYLTEGLGWALPVTTIMGIIFSSKFLKGLIDQLKYRPWTFY